MLITRRPHAPWNALLTGPRTIPGGKKSTVRLLFALAAPHGWFVEKMDIFNAYVHEPPLHTRNIFVKQMADSVAAITRKHDRKTPVQPLRRELGREWLHTSAVSIHPQTFIQTDNRRIISNHIQDPTHRLQPLSPIRMRIEILCADCGCSMSTDEMYVVHHPCIRPVIRKLS